MKSNIVGRFGRAQAHEMYALLGVRSLPEAGMPERLIQGVRVYVRPLGAETESRSRWRNWHGLRVMAICECGQHVPVGRLRQHICRKGGTS